MQLSCLLWIFTSVQKYIFILIKGLFRSRKRDKESDVETRNIRKSTRISFTAHVTFLHYWNSRKNLTNLAVCSIKGYKRTRCITNSVSFWYSYARAHFARSGFHQIPWRTKPDTIMYSRRFNVDGQKIVRELIL